MKNRFSFSQRNILLLFSMLFLVFSCNYDVSVLKPIDIDPNVEISFAEDVIPVFNANCNFSPCHSQGGILPNLSPDNAYNGLISGNYINSANPEDSELYQWMIGNRTPSMQYATQEQIANVLQWIQQGALDN